MNNRYHARKPVCMIILMMILTAGVISTVSADNDRESISFSANQSRSEQVDGVRKVELSGDARVETDTITITAQKITLSGEQYRHALCENNVVVVDTSQDITIRTTRLEYDRETSTAVSRGWTELEDRGNGLTARGGYLENSGDTGKTLIQIAARIMKDTEDGPMICRADAIVFDNEAQLLELTGNAFVQWAGDEYKAARIIVDLETDDITLEGDVSGTIYD